MGLLRASTSYRKRRKENKKKEKQKKGFFFKTEYDRILDGLHVHSGMKVGELAGKVGITKDSLGRDLQLLVKHKLVRINYPVNVFSEGLVFLEKGVHVNVPKPPIKIGKLENVYEVRSDYVRARVKIFKSLKENVYLYNIKIPRVDVGTNALLNELKDELVESLDILNEEIVDSKKFLEIKTKFLDAALLRLEERLPHEKIEVKKLLAGLLLHQMYGLGEIEVMMADEYLEEIIINNSRYPLVVYHKMHGWMKTSQRVQGEEDIFNLAAQIGRKANRQINSLHPIMDAQLFSGDRVAATLFPISMLGHTITLRKFSKSPWTIAHYVSEKYKLMSYEMAALLWVATQYEMNIMIAGSTAAGKTSVLNALNVFIPNNQRVISIEDTKEISLPKSLHWNWVPLLSRSPNQEGEGGVSMLDLMIASLRMRPDRIIIGEVRERKQVETMFEAMNTGHSIYATMHADTVEQLRRRLLELPIAIPKNEVEALHLVLVLYRDRRKGIRRALELAEILQEEGSDLEVNYLYRWHPRKDKFEQVNKPLRLVEDLNIHTGMTVNEMQRDIAMKIKILKWMVWNKAFEAEKVERVMDMYYRDERLLLSYVLKNKKYNDVLGE